mmetsp:Transcript_87662/g.253171  ORF Transcript_87662/g.253171 Transcript_87662/m.253171 type:complete len:224 (+) Transcript_87662:90-761(+)|eukprot:CAMPEP_0176081502 /NCGR_PEP_ID=MMETSP0120_2-20121206/40769_1 /TAXON_ID=160619 /ORGANISM="Kryptoperidinium foliaceum, Strain CCMP 1326" /LENGTH=223 /DNA_ID=CAMNT_0017415271 /DNA_START=91 /DNA_END=762 /DNA_ORIENTATION=+
MLRPLGVATILATVLGTAWADEACTSASCCDSGDVEGLMQVRKTTGEIHISEASALPFGLTAVGTDMWKQRTWTDVVSEVQGTMALDDTCATDTGGTCGLTDCDIWHGPTECKAGKCLCPPGFCAKEGKCWPKEASSCARDTGGSCWSFNCDGSRGPTFCEEHKCVCGLGHCAWGGKCLPMTDTGGTCHMMGCDATRGETTCHEGRCLCKDGYIALDGKCTKL